MALRTWTTWQFGQWLNSILRNIFQPKLFNYPVERTEVASPVVSLAHTAE